MQTAPYSRPGKRSSRAMAGKALAIFLVLMAALTLANNALNELAVAQVDTVSPQRGALERRVDASGELSAREVLPVYAEAAVHVAGVWVRAGQTVSAGDPLFTLDQSALDDLVKEAREALDTAATDLAEAEQALAWAKSDMSKNALDKYADAQKDVDDAQAAYDQAVSTGNSARNVQYKLEALQDAIRARDRMGSVREYFNKEAALAKAQKSHEDAKEKLLEAERIARAGTVTAPQDAQVIQVDLQAGGTASTSAAALTLAPMEGALELLVTVSADQAKYIEAGDLADITVSSQLYEAPVISISPSAEESGRFELAFLLPADAGRVGMTADMELRKRTKNYDLLVPLSALRQDNQGYYVYVVVRKDGALGAQTTAERANVSVIEQDATRAAVQGGVGQRDEIVTRSDRDLDVGDRVRVKE